jgi:uncharacterized membrane protein (UPF0182 family)
VTARRWIAFLLVTAAVALLVAREAALVYADYRWYRAMGALSVWEARMSSLLLLRLAGGAGIGLFAFANFYAVRRSVVSLVLPRRIGNLDIGEEVSSRSLTGVALLLAVAVAAALALSLDDWSGFLLARIGQPFGETDPYFARDLGFFTYRLPFESFLFTWVTASVLCIAAVVVFLYVLTPGLRLEQGRLHVSEYIRRHLAVLGGVVVLLLAWHVRLDMYGVLLDGSGPGGAFGAVDHRVGIPGNLVLSMVTLAAGLIVIWAGWTGQRRLLAAAVAAIVVTGVTTRDVAPFIAARFPDQSDSTARERPYEATRAGYTRRAYSVDRIVAGDTAAAFPSLADAALGVSVWDPGPLARAVEAESRLEAGARVGWSTDRDGLVGIVASPEPPPGPGEAAPVGTAVRALATAADDRGAPMTLVEPGVEPEASLLAPALVLDQPLGYAVIPDSAGVVRGVPLGSPFERLVEGLSVQNLRLWLSELPEPRPVLVTRRDARERVEALAPFFVQGSRVTPLVFGDSLDWVIDLYSSSSTYPLSHPFVLAGAPRSYFQHAATALVHSSTGQVQLVADPDPDPIARTWFAEFPSLFVAQAAIPPRILAALPPATDAARAVSLAFGRYGTRTLSGVPMHPPVVDGADSTLAGELPVVALPHGGPVAVEFPLLDQAERVRGVFVAEGGAARRMAWLPDSAARGPVWHDVLERLAAADSSARQGTGSVVHGVTRAFMLGRHVAFAQPAYRWTPGAVPALLHVSYLVGDTARVAPTLRQGSGLRIAPAPNRPMSAEESRRALRDLYQAMRDALRRGDWVAFGKAFDALGTLIGRPVP